jgi:hypothetical protein
MLGPLLWTRRTAGNFHVNATSWSGAEIEELDQQDARRQAAIRELKRELAPTVRATDAQPAATLPRERFLEPLATMPPGDAYQVRCVHLEGQSVAALAHTQRQGLRAHDGTQIIVLPIPTAHRKIGECLIPLGL